MSLPMTSWISSLGWALVHFLWQGLLIGMIAAVALTVLRNARPQARYLVACLALLACVLVPGWEFVHGLRTTTDAAVTDAAQVFIMPTSPATALPLVATDAWQGRLQPRLPWIVALWSVGAALLALRMALGLAWIGRVQRIQATDVEWQRRLDRLAARLGLSSFVRLHVVDELDGPIAAGCWRPMVIVPGALLARMSPELLEALLAHELAHIRRHDYLVNLAQSAVEALLFYHPVVWWLSKQIRIEREQIADDLAAQAVGAPLPLALALQQLDEFQRHNTQLAIAASGGTLMSRIQRLIRPNAHALTWKMALPILGLMAVCLAAYANTQSAQIVLKPGAQIDLKPATPVAATPVVAATQPVDPVDAVDTVEPADAVEPVEATDTIDVEDAEDEADDGSPMHVYMGDKGDHQTYALVRAGDKAIRMIGNWRDHDEIEKLRKTVKGDFLWVRRGDHRYLIQDPSVLAQFEQAWQPTEALDVKMDALNKQMEPHNREMEALNRQMEALNAKHEPNDQAMEALNRQLEPISRQQETLGAQMETLGTQMAAAKDDGEREALDRKMQALQSQMDELDRQMQPTLRQIEAQSRQIEADSRPMEELGRKMEQAGKPMEALGKQMDVLGKQMDQLAKAAEQTSRSLIDRAIDSGTARPFDNPRVD